MFASLHSAFSSSSSKYAAGHNSKSYVSPPTTPARFSVQVMPKPSYTPYYAAPNPTPAPMESTGYRPSLSQAPSSRGAPRYDDRYQPHVHSHSPPQPSRLNTTAPRPYNPKPQPPIAPVSIPAPQTPRSHPQGNFTFYPGNAQDTFIYEQSQGSKSDLLSTSEFESTSSPTDSLSSTVTMRGADTPATETLSLEPSPVEPSTSRRNSLVFNGGASPVEGDFRGVSASPASRPAFPPHMVAAMTRTSSESSIDIRERIALVNAQHNSASTGSYYTSSPDLSTSSQPPQPHRTHSTTTPSGHSPNQQPPLATDPYLQSNTTITESVPAHIIQPSGGRSRSVSPPQQQQLRQHQAYSNNIPERPASRHEGVPLPHAAHHHHHHTDLRRSPSTTPQGRPTSVYGATSAQQTTAHVPRSPPDPHPNQHFPSTSPPVGREDYFSQPPFNAPRQSPPQHYPQALPYSTSTKPEVRQEWREHINDRGERRQASPSGSDSPPSPPLPRQTSSSVRTLPSSYGAQQDRRYHHSATAPPSGSGDQEPRRYSPPSTSVQYLADDAAYLRETSVLRRQRKVSYTARPTEAPVAYSSSSGSSSSSSSNSTARGGYTAPDYASSRDRDYHPRDPRDRRTRVYNHEQQPSQHQQQSTVPFVKSTPPSPPNPTVQYPLAPVHIASSSRQSNPAPERMSTRTRSSSMSVMPSPSTSTYPHGRGPKHPDVSLSSSSTTPASYPIPMPTPLTMPQPSLPDGSMSMPEPEHAGPQVYRRRRMSVISQVSNAGSMATIATTSTMNNTAASSSLPPPHTPSPPPQPRASSPSHPDRHHDHHRSSALNSNSSSTTSHPQRSAPGNATPSSYHRSEQPPLPPSQHPAPYRRLSDGDRPISNLNVRTHDLKSSNHPSQTAHHQQQYATAATAQHPPPHPETQRRYSDGDQNPPPSAVFRQQLPRLNTVDPYYQQQQQQQHGSSRNVRWNDNLICPSPIFPAEKRKGWYNRRGDQLWTNDGLFRPAPADEQYPEDLDDYPDHGEGWQNEDGVRIDMEHRRVPKVPRRSALKPSFAGPGVIAQPLGVRK